MPRNKTTWEYKFTRVPDSEFPDDIMFLDNDGAEGWEFTGYARDTGFATEYLMKRRIIV